MKKTGLLLTALCLASIVALPCGLIACGEREHTHNWSAWTVPAGGGDDEPSLTHGGKATRVCLNDGCDATAEDKEYPLPDLTSKDYAVGKDSATCVSGGSVTYTYDKDGVKVSVQIATDPDPDAHDYGNYAYVDGSGHYKVCSHNSEHKTKTEAHDENGADGACSLCKYKPTVSGNDYGELSPNDGSTTVTVGGGNTATVVGYTKGDAYWTYSYVGAKPITIAYSYYVSGKGTVSDTVTLSADGETSFVAYIESKRNCQMTVTSTEKTAFDATITAEFSESDPNAAPNILTLDTDAEITAGYFDGVTYTFTAAETGVYVLTCTGGAASLFVDDGEEESELPYYFELAEGETITLIFYSATSGEATFAARVEKAPEHSHDWGAWTVTEQNKPDDTTPGKATRVCKGAGICDGTADESEFKLPDLNDKAYVKSDDDATCSEKGKITYTYIIDEQDDVSVSFDIETQINPDKHTWNKFYTTDVAATCESDGSESIHCANCGKSQDNTSQVVQKLAHSWNKFYTVDVAATCESDGSESIHCANCGKSQDGSSQVVQKLAHSWNDDYTVDVAATCESDGSKSKHCENCDAIQDDSAVTLAALGHAYGEWIFDYPTVALTGKATKVCANDVDREHDIVVILPVLPQDGNGGYASVVPDAADEYINVYTYASLQYGDIVFKVSSKLTVEQAVKAAAANNRDAVEGTIAFIQDMKDADGNTVASADNVSFFEYGDDYLHIDDQKEGVEKWYTHYDGKFLAITTQDFTYSTTDGDVVLDTTNVTKLIKDKNAYDVGENKIFDGFAMNFWLFGSGHIEYGAANYLAYLYGFVKSDLNGDAWEKVDAGSGVTEYSFGFGYFDNGNNKYFHVITASFTLGDSHVLESASLECKTYVNAVKGYDRDNNPIYATPTYKDLGDGKAAVITGMESVCANHEVFTITQSTTHASGAAPVSPHDYEKLLVDSFKLVDYRGAEVKDALELDVGYPTVLTLAGLNPSDCNLDVDPITFILRHEIDGRTVETELSSVYTDGNEWNIVMYYNEKSKSFTLTPYVAGELTLIVKTMKVTKEIVLSIPYSAPTDFGAQVYKIVDENTDRWEWRRYDTEFTVYTDQPLAFSSFVKTPAYEDASFTVTAGDATVTDGVINGYKVKLFKASTAGLYTVTLTSSNGQKASFAVNVVEAPTAAEILDGVYVNDDAGITVTFAPQSKGSAHGTATIEKGDDVTVIEYSCGATGAVATNYVSGAIADYRFEITDRKTLFIRYTDVGERLVYIHREGEVAKSLDGTYRLTSAANASTHVVTVTGTYVIEYDTRCVSIEDMPYTRFYDVNGETTYGVALRVLVDLVAGDELKVYAVADGINNSLYTYKITYQEAIVDVTGVALDKTEITLDESTKTALLVATVAPGNASRKDVVWSSSDNKVATVSQDGVVTAMSKGTATITVTTVDGGFEATCLVTVDILQVASITLSQTSVTLTYDAQAVANGEGDFVRLTATVLPAEAPDLTVIWSSSDNSVARVNFMGMVSVSGVGTATITVTSQANPNVSATCVVTVVEASAPPADIDPTGITLDKTSHELEKGGSFDLVATVSPDDATDKSVTWTSSDESVATVVNGTVTAVGKGTATITATTCNGLTAECFVTVTEPETPPEPPVTIEPTDIALDKTSHELEKGGSFDLTATVSPDDATDKTVTWTSSDESVATVVNGAVTAVGKGTATITATTCNGLTAECFVTVTEPETPPEPPVVDKRIELSSESLAFTAFTPQQIERQPLTATVYPESASGEELVWELSKSGVVVLNDGTDEQSRSVTAIAYGVVDITVSLASDPTVKATCHVLVGRLTESVSFASSEINVNLYGPYGNTETNVSLYISPTDGLIDGTFTVDISDPSVLDVEYSSGNKALTLKPKKAGAAVVTVTMNDGSGKQATCNVTVFDNTLSEGVNEIPETATDGWSRDAYFKLDLEPGTYTITATRDGQEISNFNIYDMKSQYTALGCSCEITITSGDRFIKIVDTPYSGNTIISPFLLTITKKADVELPDPVDPGEPEYEVIELGAGVALSLSYAYPTPQSTSYSLLVEAGKTYVFTLSDYNNNNFSITVDGNQIMSYAETGSYTATKSGYVTVVIAKVGFGTTTATVTITEG